MIEIFENIYMGIKRLSLALRHKMPLPTPQFLGIVMFFCHGCSDEPPKKFFKVVTTTNLLADLVKNIVKDDIHIESLMGPGIDPHTYQVTQRDAQKLKNADLIIYNGLYLEGKMAGLLKIMARTKPTYAASRDIDKQQLITDQEATPLGVDPHIWFDIQLWMQVLVSVSNKLQEMRPHVAHIYQKNTIKYAKILKQLHQEVASKISSIPKRQRVLVTAHDAFSYFGRAYNIKVVGLQGISTVSECGLQDIQRIVKLLVDKSIKAVFFETSVSDKSMRAVLEGCAHHGHQVSIGGALYSDSLGLAGTNEGTYCGMVRTNTQMIVQALK